MATDVAESPPQIEPMPRIRIAYRARNGAVELDWPADRLAEAIADEEGTVWVDIENPDGDTDRVEALFRNVFHFHPLAIDDALLESHIPKLDDWVQYVYLVFHSIDFDPETDGLRLHELDIFLGHSYLVTYHNEPINVLDLLRRNLERDNGERLRRGADYLLYLILDLGTAEFLT